jgi:cation diffusion facilitator CzcD-associated flavoprotein CzcO
MLHDTVVIGGGPAGLSAALNGAAGGLNTLLPERAPELGGQSGTSSRSASKDVIVETPRAKTLVLDVPGWPGHVAGQHVDVRLTAEDGYQASRSYSIASAPEHDRRRGLAPLMLLNRKCRAGEDWIQGGAG